MGHVDLDKEQVDNQMQVRIFLLLEQVDIFGAILFWCCKMLVFDRLGFSPLSSGISAV